MKFLSRLLLSAGMLATVTACGAGISRTTIPSPVPAGSSLHGVFEGITPCSAQAGPLPQIPAEPQNFVIGLVGATIGFFGRVGQSEIR